MKRWTIVLVGIIALALVADVMAAQPPGGERRPGPPGGPEGRGPRGGFRMPLMVALDADENGELSAEEIKNAAAALKKLDKNNDGKLDAEEMRPQRPGGPRQPGGADQPGAPRQSFLERMMALDKNGDKKLSKDELPERMQGMLDRLDTNKDGAVDEAELKAAAERFGTRGGRPSRGPGGADRPERPPRPE